MMNQNLQNFEFYQLTICVTKTREQKIKKAGQEEFCLKIMVALFSFNFEWNLLKMSGIIKSKL